MCPVITTPDHWNLLYYFHQKVLDGRPENVNMENIYLEL